MEGFISITAKKALLHTILHPLVGNILDCLCKNLVLKFLLEALPSRLHLCYCRCKDDFVEEVLSGFPTLIDFLSDIPLFLKIDQKMLGNYWP